MNRQFEIPNFQRNDLFEKIINSPDVKLLKYEDIFEDQTRLGRKIKRADYQEAGDYPIIDQGKEYIGGYTNEELGLYMDLPCIIFGDHTRIVKYIDRPIFLGADGVKLLKVKDSEINTKYIYYLLNNFNIPNTGYNRHFKYIKDMLYPIVSKHLQLEIVEALESIEKIIDLKNEQISDLETLKNRIFIDKLLND